MKIIIAGSRSFDDYQLLKTFCDEYLRECWNKKLFKKKEDIEIISGKCPEGADLLGEYYRKDRGFKGKDFPADWDNLAAEKVLIKINSAGKRYNALAGHNRNEEMAKYGEILIVFWDGKSTGTKNMIELANKYDLEVVICPTDKISVD